MDDTQTGAGEETPAPNTKPVFDFANYDIAAIAERGTTFQLLNPKSGMPSGVTMQVYGGDARSYRTNLRRGQDAVAAAPEKEPTDADDALLLSRARAAAAAVMSWSGVYVEDQEIEFNYNNAVELFSRYSWAADQVIMFINQRGNF